MPGAIHVGERAVELATEFGLPGLAARALNAVGTARWFTDADLAEQTLARSVQAAQYAGDDAAAGAALVNLGSGAGEVRRYPSAMRWLSEAITWCGDRDLDNSRGYAMAWLARCLFERGEWPAAEILDEAWPPGPGTCSGCGPWPPVVPSWLGCPAGPLPRSRTWYARHTLLPCGCAGLTERQADVLALLREGLGNAAMPRG